MSRKKLKVMFFDSKRKSVGMFLIEDELSDYVELLETQVGEEVDVASQPVELEHSPYCLFYNAEAKTKKEDITCRIKSSGLCFAKSLIIAKGKDGKLTDMTTKDYDRFRKKFKKGVLML